VVWVVYVTSIVSIMVLWEKNKNDITIIYFVDNDRSPVRESTNTYVIITKLP